MKPLIIFYDGYCVLCNFWVRKLCLWDRKDCLRFAPLESAIAEAMVKKTKINRSNLDSVLVWDQQNEPLAESEGVFRVLKALGGLWYLFLAFKLLPASFLNWMYRGVAKNIYRWFSKKESCPLPSPSIKHKFL